MPATCCVSDDHKQQDFPIGGGSLYVQNQLRKVWETGSGTGVNREKLLELTYLGHLLAFARLASMIKVRYCAVVLHLAIALYCPSHTARSALGCMRCVVLCCGPAA
jgi:hypothetical protein